MADLIDRQAAIDVLGVFTQADALGHTPKQIVEALPSAEPERKTGKWIYNSPVTMKCNQCGFVIKDWDCHRFKCCPNCGANMKGEQDD